MRSKPSHPIIQSSAVPSKVGVGRPPEEGVTTAFLAEAVATGVAIEIPKIDPAAIETAGSEDMLDAIVYSGVLQVLIAYFIA